MPRDLLQVLHMVTLVERGYSAFAVSPYWSIVIDDIIRMYRATQRRRDWIDQKALSN